MTRKRILMLIGCVCLAVMLAVPMVAGCAAPAPTPTPTPTPATGEMPTYGTWRLADNHPPEEPCGLLFQDLIAEWEKRSDGRIKIDYYPSMQLGGQEEVWDAMNIGTIEIGLAVPQERYDPRFAIAMAPYLFFTWEQFMEANKPGGWLTEILEPLYEGCNLHYLGYIAKGFAGVSLHEVPDILPPDQSDLKVRVLPNESWVKTWEALGYKPVFIVRPEFYTSV